MIECVNKGWLSFINFESTNLQLKPLHLEMKMHINFCSKFGLPDFSNLDDCGGPFAFYFCALSGVMWEVIMNAWNRVGVTTEIKPE